MGGLFEVQVLGCPPGLGSYTHWDRKLDARLAMALMSIQAIKGVEVGTGFAVAGLPGSRVHDEIFRDAARVESGSISPYFRGSNNAGGIEGGMSNGEPIVLRAAMKPIATLRTPLHSVELGTHRAVDSRFERSDTCAVPAAAVAGEAVVALCLADALMGRFPAATVEELRAAVQAAGERDRLA
jgi:chorismate synthase